MQSYVTFAPTTIIAAPTSSVKAKGMLRKGMPSEQLTVNKEEL
jgi:hypothetical protein